ncbi:MAG: DUF4433 domain-containing protein, partial [Planctomycetota bacterium]
MLQKGILCHRRMEEEGVQTTPIYDKAIVSDRHSKQVEGGKNLWDY